MKHFIAISLVIFSTYAQAYNPWEQLRQNNSCQTYCYQGQLGAQYCDTTCVNSNVNRGY